MRKDEGVEGGDDGMSKPPSPPDGADAHVPPLRTSPIGFLRDNATVFTLALTTFGGILYVVLTRVSYWVYAPAGVTPSEVGLGYGPLLLGTAVALAVALAIVLAPVLLAFGAAWVRRKNAKVFALAAVVFVALAVASWFFSDVSSFYILPLLLTIPLLATLVVGLLWPGHVYKGVAIASTILVLAVAGLSMWYAATNARRHIKEASSSGQFALFELPWEGQIALLRRIDSPPSSARCGLYLGEANGIGVFEFAVIERGTIPRLRTLRTLRFPLTSMNIEIVPDAWSCSDVDVRVEPSPVT
jgi:hypothetical protein